MYSEKLVDFCKLLKICILSLMFDWVHVFVKSKC